MLYDATGKEIYKRHFAGIDQADINLSGFRTGIYFAKVGNGYGFKTIKIIKN